MLYSAAGEASSFRCEGEAKLLFGTIAAVSGNNLGSLAIGGFKESCSSYRLYRECMATPNSARTQVVHVHENP